MEDALEAACNDPLPAYAKLSDKVAEDGVDTLRQMLDVAMSLMRNECFYFLLCTLFLRYFVKYRFVWGACKHMIFCQTINAIMMMTPPFA
ncbi:hypothetical protein Hanom_Chr01g00057501 [Helianthus anomalus]